MIEIRYLQAESGANKFGTCNCCGKSSGEDPLMISVKFNYCGHGMTICLCDDCKKKLMEALLPANCSEIPNSSDTISRAKAIEALLGITAMRNTIPLDSAIFNIKKLPSAQPEIIRCKDCKHWIPYDWMFSEVWQSKNIADYPEDEIGCNYCDMAMKANDFCSRGEMREVTT